MIRTSIPQGPTHRSSHRSTYRVADRGQASRARCVTFPDHALIEAEQLEQRRQIAEFLTGGRRGAADEVEDLAVLQAVIGEPADLAVLVEIDGDHALVDHLLVHE